MLLNNPDPDFRNVQGYMSSIGNEISLRIETDIKNSLIKYPDIVRRVCRVVSSKIDQLEFDDDEGNHKVVKSGYVRVALQNWILKDWIVDALRDALIEKAVLEIPLLEALIEVQQDLVPLNPYFKDPVVASKV